MHTGSSNFYDKFNVRYYIAALMKYIWSLPEHRTAVQVASTYVLLKLPG